MNTLTRSLLSAALLAPLSAPALAGGSEIELDEADVFIEFNSTDGDFGIQFFWDGEPWKRMSVGVEGSRPVLNVKTRGNVTEQGLTEGFFESAEPSADELSMEEFLERFPEGTYEFEGKTLEGDELEGEAEFTHVMPAPPSGLLPADGDIVNAAAPLTLSIDPVTESLTGDDIEIELYEFVLEVEIDGEDRIWTVLIGGDEDDLSMDVPPQFLKPGLEYKFEVIAEEESGNRTITEAVFETV